MTDVRKKFNIGLMLDASLSEYEKFLQTYAMHIHSVYFSIPLGARFHTREYVAKQFEKVENIQKFWQILEVLQMYKIELELVLNTFHLSEQDISNAIQLLADKDIQLNYITILDKYYDTVDRLVPNVPKVFSYNNFLNDITEVKKEHKYSYYVIGGKNIRNTKVLEAIRKERNGKTILLLNNGCNHSCGWCGESSKHCEQAFQQEHQKHSVEEMYARQSIMPYELNENFIRMEEADLFKINCRNAGFEYLISCLRSYLKNENLELTKTHGSKALSYWSRLSWFYKYFDSIDLDKMMEYKKKLYKGNSDNE